MTETLSIRLDSVTKQRLDALAKHFLFFNKFLKEILLFNYAMI